MGQLPRVSNACRIPPHKGGFFWNREGTTGEAALQRGAHVDFLESKIGDVAINCLGAVKWRNCCVAFCRFICIFSECETKLWWVIGSAGH